VTEDILKTKIEKKSPTRCLFYKIPEEFRIELSTLAQVQHKKAWNSEGVAIWGAIVAVWNKCYDCLKFEEKNQQLQKQEDQQIKQHNSLGLSNKNNENEPKIKKEAQNAKKSKRNEEDHIDSTDIEKMDDEENSIPKNLQKDYNNDNFGYIEESKKMNNNINKSKIIDPDNDISVTDFNAKKLQKNYNNNNFGYIEESKKMDNNISELKVIDLDNDKNVADSNAKNIQNAYDNNFNQNEEHEKMIINADNEHIRKKGPNTWDIKFLDQNNNKIFYIILHDSKKLLFPLITLNTLLDEGATYVHL
jgi:hypothetical protein